MLMKQVCFLCNYRVGDNCSDRKKHKDRVTIILGSNIIEMNIGKLTKPICFKKEFKFY